MKIGFITRNYPPNIEGGAEISLSLLADSLAKKGHKIKIFVPEDKITTDSIEGTNPKIYRFKWDKKTPFSLENPFSVKKFCNKVFSVKENIDILDGWNYITPLPIISKKLDIPYIVSLRDATALCDLRFNANPQKLNFLKYFKVRFHYNGFSLKEILNGIFGFYLTEIRQKIIKKANYVTFASTALKQIYKDINKNSSVVFSITVPQKNINTDKKIFLYAGRQSKGKGAYLFQEASKEINSERKDIKLIPIFKKTHKEVLNSIKNSYAVVVPSLVFEAFPRMAIEAVASGKPVIGTNIGGIPEAIGEAGIVINPDKKSLTEAIVKLADDRKLYCRLKSNTLNQAKKFTESIISEKVLNIYKEVLK